MTELFGNNSVLLYVWKSTFAKHKKNQDFSLTVLFLPFADFFFSNTFAITIGFA